MWPDAMIFFFFFLNLLLANWIELINGNLFLWQALEECETLGTPPTEQSRIELEFRIEEAKENIRKAEVMRAARLSPFAHTCDILKHACCVFVRLTQKEKFSGMITLLFLYSKRAYRGAYPHTKLSCHFRRLIVHKLYSFWRHPSLFTCTVNTCIFTLNSFVKCIYLSSISFVFMKGQIREEQARSRPTSVRPKHLQLSVMNAFPFPDRDAFSLSLLICSETGCQSLCLIDVSSPLRCPAVSLHMSSSSRGALCWPCLWPLLYVKVMVHLKMIIVIINPMWL